LSVCVHRAQNEHVAFVFDSTEQYNDVMAWIMYDLGFSPPLG